MLWYLTKHSASKPWGSIAAALKLHKMDLVNALLLPAAAVPAQNSGDDEGKVVAGTSRGVIEGIDCDDSKKVPCPVCTVLLPPGLKRCTCCDADLTLPLSKLANDLY